VDLPLSLSDVTSTYTKSAAILALFLVLVPGLVLLAASRPSRELAVWEALLVLLSWAGLKVRGLAWSDVGLTGPNDWFRVSAMGAAGALVLLGGSLILRIGLKHFLGWTTDTSAFSFITGDPWALAAGLAIAWLLGAVGEELLYRGFLLDTIHVLLPGRLGSSLLGWWLSVGLTSVLFGLAHGFQGRAAVVVAAAIAMGYGAILRLGGGNLWPVIVTHGLYDTVAFMLLFKGVRIGG
jgi:membrane protease YdiL (CAAX protease family)